VISLTALSYAVLTVVQAIVGCLKAALKSDKQPSEDQIISKYDKLCVVVDEVIHEVCPLGNCIMPAATLVQHQKKHMFRSHLSSL
jgi:hypothetical protein